MVKCNNNTVQQLLELLPQLSQAEATQFLYQADGIIEDACELAMDADRWISGDSSRKKKYNPKDKKKDMGKKVSTYESASSNSNINISGNKRPFDRKPRNLVSSAVSHAPKPLQSETPVESNQPQSAKVVMLARPSNTAKLNGVSFADILKRKAAAEQYEEEVEEVAEEAEAHEEEEVLAEEVAANEEVITEQIVIIEHPEQEVEDEEDEESDEIQIPAPKPHAIEVPQKIERPMRVPPTLFVPEYEKRESVVLPGSLSQALTSRAVVFSGTPGVTPRPVQHPKPAPLPQPVVPVQQPQPQQGFFGENRNEWVMPPYNRYGGTQQQISRQMWSESQQQPSQQPWGGPRVAQPMPWSNRQYASQMNQTQRYNQYVPQSTGGYPQRPQGVREPLGEGYNSMGGMHPSSNAVSEHNTW